MIKIKSKLRGDCPVVNDRDGNNKIENGVNVIKRIYASDAANFNTRNRMWTSQEIDSSIYGHKSIKERLVLSQHGKCAFCEQNITSVDYGDIEHFRPKKAWKQNDKSSISGPGYYWLSYDFSNLLLACKICNGRHKGNLFPIRRPEYRARNHNEDDKLFKEKPFFINPAKENPKDMIRFNKAIAVGIDKNHRGKKTIEAIGLNRKSNRNGISDLYEIRLKHYDLVEKANWLANQEYNMGIPKALIDESKKSMKEMRSRTSQFSAMVNDNFPA